jgi:hypothetical protein
MIQNETYPKYSHSEPLYHIGLHVTCLRRGLLRDLRIITHGHLSLTDTLGYLFFVVLDSLESYPWLSCLISVSRTNSNLFLRKYLLFQRSVFNLVAKRNAGRQERLT